MNNEPNKQEETKKPEQTPADLLLNKNAEKQSNEQVSSTKEFVKPTEKASDISSTTPIQ